MSMNRRQVTAGLAGALAGAVAMPRIARAQGEPIRIGLISSLSGPAQIYGDANRIGAEIAAERINAAGGVKGRKVEIILRDDKAQSDLTVSAYRDLTASGVRFFIAGPISGTVVALAPLFKDTNNVLVAAGPNNLSITHELFNPNVFRLQLTSIPVFEGLGKVVAEKNPDVKDWIGISNDQQANIDLSNIFLNSVKKTLAEKGVTANIHELVLTKQGAGDFRSPIATLASSGATGVLNSLVGSDSLTFYKQAKSFGLDQKVRIFADVSANLASMATIANATPKSVWTPPYWHAPGDPNPISQEVYKAAVVKADTPYPYGFIALAHDAVVAIAEALKTAGADDAKSIIPVIEGQQPMGAVGPIEFRKEDHTYIGTMTFINFGADPSAKDGLKVAEVVRIPSLPYMEPPTPGKPYAIK
ncbi:amino acid/amide ABC transporter substrate-binding protein, HAAT family [Rhizobiales bacterium GAS113]|nr:amino acid/amide ABC transporter substrate-binding protein, HAAT family [Rhizobiales bacterium GAS113]